MKPRLFCDLKLFFWWNQVILRDTSRSELCKLLQHSKSMKSSPRCQKLYSITTVISDIFCVVLTGLLDLLHTVFLCSEHFYTCWSKWQFSPEGGHAQSKYCAHDKTGKCNILQHLPLDCQFQRLLYQGHFQGLGMQFIFLSLLLLNVPQNTLLESIFAAIADMKRGFSTTEEQAVGDAAPRACLWPLLSLPVPTRVLCHSSLLPELPPAAKTALRSGHVLHTLCPYGCETLEDWGRFTPCLCHQKWSYTQSGQQQALWLQLGWFMPAWNLIL